MYQVHLIIQCILIITEPVKYIFLTAKASQMGDVPAGAAILLAVRLNELPHVHSFPSPESDACAKYRRSSVALPQSPGIHM